MSKIIFHLGDIQFASQCIAYGVNVNIKCSGRTALYEAIINGILLKFKFIISRIFIIWNFTNICTGKRDVATWLVNNGAYVYEISPEGPTLYELAAAKGKKNYFLASKSNFLPFKNI